MPDFRWTEKATTVAIALAQGYTQIDAAAQAEVSDRTIRSWLTHPEFSAEVDRLSLMVGIASRAERLRIAQRAIRQRTPGDVAISKADLLDWLKYAQSETDGIKLDLAAAFAALTAPVAGSGPDGSPPTLPPGDSEL